MVLGRPLIRAVLHVDYKASHTCDRPKMLFDLPSKSDFEREGGVGSVELIPTSVSPGTWGRKTDISEKACFSYMFWTRTE